MRASSVSVAARLLLALSLCLAGSSLWLTPAEAQFVCADVPGGTGQGANAAGSLNNFACGQNANASGSGSFNTAVGPNSNAGLDSDASGNGSSNSAYGNGSKAS